MSLRLARKIARLEQEDLAKKAGLDPTALCRLERTGRDLRELDYQTVVRIAKALNLEPEELFAIAALTDPIPIRGRVVPLPKPGKRRATGSGASTQESTDRHAERA